MTNQGDIEGQASGAGMLSPLCDTSILRLSIQSASRSGEATGRPDETFPMETHSIGIKLLLGDGFIGCCLSTY